MDTVGMVILAISALALLESPRRTSAARSGTVAPDGPPPAADPPSTPRGVSDRGLTDRAAADGRPRLPRDRPADRV